MPGKFEVIDLEIIDPEKAAVWRESDHPRADDGRFGHGSGGGATDKPEDDSGAEGSGQVERASQRPAQDERTESRDFTDDLRGGNDDEAIAYFESSSPRFTPEQAEEVEYYQRRGYSDVNAYHRTGEVPADSRDEYGLTNEDMETTTRALDSALESSSVPGPVKVYRAVSGETDESTFGAELVARIEAGELPVGSVMVDKGYTSTSVDRDFVTNRYGSAGVIFEMDVPEGNPGIYLNAAWQKTDPEWGAFKHERELLLPRETAYEVEAIEPFDASNWSSPYGSPPPRYVVRGRVTRPQSKALAGVDAMTSAIKADILTRPAETFYVSPQHALKALGDGRIGGYLAAFGLPRDKQGEYFDRDTEFHLDWYGDGPRPVLYHHGLDADAQADAIGHVVALAPDEFGLFATAELDMLNPLAQKVYEQICKGRIGWSSGSIPHLVRVADDGKIAEWPIVEASLTPTPAEPFRTNVQALKAMITAWEGETAALDRAIEVDGETNAPAAPDRPAAPDAPALDTDTLDETQPVPARAAKAAPRARKGKIMDTATIMAALEKAGLSADQIVAVLKELGAQGAEMEAPEAEAPAEAIMADVPPEDEQQPEIKASAGAPVFDAKAFARTIRAELDAAQKAAPGQSRAVPFTGNGNGRKAADIQVYSKYRGLKAADMAFLMHLRGAIARQSGLVHQPGDAYVREMTIKAQKEISDGSLVVEPRVAQRILAIKDNENNSRGVTTDGSDWTTTVMSSDLWERARVDNQVLANLNTVEMPSDSYDLPIESTDPTVYAVAETTNEAQLTLVTNGTFTDSKVTVGKVTLNAAKMGLQVRFSAEINEDSVIPFIPQLRTQSLRAMQDAIDNVILNADATTGTGNINYKGANTSAAATSKFLYGGGDGVRHLALVDNTDLAVDAGGAAPTLTLWRSALSKMTNAYSVRPADIVAFCDVKTYHKLKSIDELLVYMNNGRGSTVVDGMVPTIDGSPVYPSAELALTDSTGYAMAAGTGTLGQVVFVYKPGWYVGYRRQIASAVDYLAYYDAYVLTMTVRLALARRDTGVAALLYNLAV